jgi:hypothetical protein
MQARRWTESGEAVTAAIEWVNARVETSGKTRRVWLAVWALMAALNLSAGVLVSSWPDRQADLGSMRRWGRAWLVEGTNIYEAAGEAPDYPPHAIVLLSPIGLLNANRAVPAWATFNLALAVLCVYLTVRTASSPWCKSIVAPRTAMRPAGKARRPRIPGVFEGEATPPGGMQRRSNADGVAPRAASSRRAITSVALPMLMFLCWGGFRTLLQFSLLTLTCGLASIVLAGQRPVWSGLSLGFALMKPQVAAPFVLWALFTRRWRSLAVAASVVGVGFLLYCVRAAAHPLDVGASYLAILEFLYAGDAVGLIGLAQVRPLVALAVSNAAMVNAVAGGIALILLGGICALGVAESRRRSSLMYSAPALAGIWSLLTFYHLTYGFILLLPAAALLLWAEEPESRAIRRRTFWLLQAAMMFDVPGLWRWFGPALSAPAALGAVLVQSDRALAIAFFVSMTALALGRRDRFRLVKSGCGDHGEQDGAGRHS